MNPRSRPRTGGFSLVEVAISLAILAVGMTGVLALLPVGLDGARQVHAETVASQIVRGALADFSTNGFRPNSYAQITGSSPGGTLKTEFYDLEGGVTNEQAAYFGLSYVRGETNATSCRYFLEMAWPQAAVRASTNSPLIQRRTFVTDVIRRF